MLEAKDKTSLAVEMLQRPDLDEPSRKAWRKEFVEDLQDKVEKQYILTFRELKKEIRKAKLDPSENIEPLDEVLSPIEYTYCDRCGNLERIDEACWVEYLDYNNETDKNVYAGLKKEERGLYEPIVICDLCYHELAKKGEQNATNKH